MSPKFLIFLFILIFLNCIASKSFSDCTRHEIFALCNMERERTCSNPDFGGYSDEEYNCNGHCTCTQDYVRNEDGICMPVEACEITCQKNANWRECYSEDEQEWCMPEMNKEKNKCQRGCHCKRGYCYGNKNRDCMTLREFLTPPFSPPRYGRNG